MKILNKILTLGCCIIFLGVVSCSKEKNNSLVEKADILAKMSQMEEVLGMQAELNAEYLIKQDSALESNRKEIIKIFKEASNARETELVIREFYIKNYTEKEVDEMIAFFKTPTGEKSIRLVPKLQEEIASKLLNDLSANQHKLNNLIIETKTKNS